MIRKLITFFVISAFTSYLLISFLNVWVMSSTQPYMYHTIGEVPFNSVGMVLGTSKWTSSGKPNQHFANRMDAAADLYRAGKIKHLIVSGDNMTPYYDEPKMMKSELMLRGVPDYDITLDTAGFRTFDSVVRLKKVFGVNSCTIISERFHLYRALFISRHYDLDAIGYAAYEVPITRGYPTRAREILARIKAILDVYILNTEPGDRSPLIDSL
jgi:SanA protein